MAPDIWLFDLAQKKAKNITNNLANDAHPMWHGRTLYFLSDRGPNQRHNIWAVSLDSGDVRQVTHLEDFDIHFPAIGPSEIVFEAGGKIYLLDLESEKSTQVEISLVTDHITLKPRKVNVSRMIRNAQISPQGKRALFEARGEVFTVPAEHGVIRNLTASSGVAERYPAWSPDGSRLAFSSFRTGGWEIFVVDTDCLAAPETCPDRLTQITNDDSGNILPVWSPDGTRFAFNSKASGNWDIYTMAINGTDIRPVTTHPENDLSPTWSPDGSQIALESNRDGNVEVYVVAADGAGTPRNITNLSWANDHGPAWTPDGQQLVFYSNREGNWDLFATSLDGQTVTNLTQTSERDEQTPAWRP